MSGADFESKNLNEFFLSLVTIQQLRYVSCLPFLDIGLAIKCDVISGWPQGIFHAVMDQLPHRRHSRERHHRSLINVNILILSFGDDIS